MRSHGVEVHAPSFQDSSSFVNGLEPVNAQALITKPAIEGLDEAVVDWLTWPDEVEFEAALVSPSIEVFAGEFCPVVQRDHVGLSTLEDQTVEHCRDLPRWKRPLCHRRQRFSCEDIDHRQHSELPAADQCVADEVQGPALIRAMRLRRRDPHDADVRASVRF